VGEVEGEVWDSDKEALFSEEAVVILIEEVMVEGVEVQEEVSVTAGLILCGTNFNPFKLS
jgi:hypothetical protein